MTQVCSQHFEPRLASRPDGLVTPHVHESGLVNVREFRGAFDTGALRAELPRTAATSFSRSWIPSRLDKAMKALDTDGSGVIEIEEWYGMRRPFS